MLLVLIIIKLLSMKDDNNYVSRTSLTEFIGRPLFGQPHEQHLVSGWPKVFENPFKGLVFKNQIQTSILYIFNIINYCVYEHYLTENVQIVHILIQKIALNTLHIVLSPTA